MNWLKLALGVLDLAVRFARWVEREKIREEAQREELRAALERIDAEVAKANDARARVRAELSDPARLRDDQSGPWRD